MYPEKKLAWSTQTEVLHPRNFTVQLGVRKAAQERCQSNSCLHSRQMSPQAVVDTVAEGQVSVVLAGDVEPIWLLEVAGIAIGGSEEQNERLAALNGLAMQAQILCGDPGHVLGRALVPEGFFYGLIDERWFAL